VHDLTEVVVPDAKILVGIKVNRIFNSPIGQAIRAELQNSPQAFNELFRAGDFDPLRDIQEVLISSRGGRKNPPLLIAVRGRFGPEVQESAGRAQQTQVLQVAGVRVFTRAAGSESPVQALAFPNVETALAGDLEHVKAAIQAARKVPAALQAKAVLLRTRYDVWVIADSPGAALPESLRGQQASAPSQAVLNNIREFSGGLRFGNDLEIAADVIASSEPEAEKLAAALELLAGLLRQKSGTADPKTTQLLEWMRFGREGTAIRFSLTLPAEEVNRVSRAGVRRSSPAAVDERPRARSNQIIIQSSPEDMGTVVIPMPAPK
jgi:hypothetical protein